MVPHNLRKVYCDNLSWSVRALQELLKLRKLLSFDWYCSTIMNIINAAF